eukprot:15458861-Alexandrium_andersonii.AAC.1
MFKKGAQLMKTPRSRPFDISELAVQATSEFRNLPFKQLCECASGAPAGPLRPSLGSFREQC